VAFAGCAARPREGYERPSSPILIRIFDASGEWGAPISLEPNGSFAQRGKILGRVSEDGLASPSGDTILVVAPNGRIARARGRELQGLATFTQDGDAVGQNGAMKIDREGNVLIVRGGHSERIGYAEGVMPACHRLAVLTLLGLLLPTRVTALCFPTGSEPSGDCWPWKPWLRPDAGTPPSPPVGESHEGVEVQPRPRMGHQGAGQGIVRDPLTAGT
jgi:hypothetical protein